MVKLQKKWDLGRIPTFSRFFADVPYGVLADHPPGPPKPLPRLLELMIFVFKIYKEKTIEVGVFVDRHLYKNMEEVLQSYFSNGDMVIVELFLTASFLKKIHFQMLKTQDEAKVKEQFLKMIHNLFVQVLIFRNLF